MDEILPEGVAITPCTVCGACCACYRVVFGNEELDDMPEGWVPSGLVESIDKLRVAMLGTSGRKPRCIALKGVIGQNACCDIYHFRPSPCRSYAAQAAAGTGDICCADARRHHGLPPLAGSYEAALMF